jgi:flagellar hook-basal body complex protein FliE
MIPGIGTNISSIVSQLNATTPSKAGGGSSAGGFGDVFKAAVQQVDDLQTGADQQIGSMLQGKGGADVGNVMASVEKADVAFQLMMQVRNKIVSAYQDIEKMQF